MKVTQISEHIWSLGIWMLIPVHVWVVVEEDGVTLVDAGIPTMADGIRACIESLNAGPLKRIVLTHGHSDHVGAIRRVLRTDAVPVYAHRIEIPYMEGDLPYPRRKKAAASVPKGIAQVLGEETVQAPEAPGEGTAGELQPIGGLTPYHTPGHSPGHVVYYHQQDRVLLAGDLFTSRKGRLRRPMPLFTADMREAVRSSEIVRQLQPERLEVCHGGPVFDAAGQLDAYIAAAAKRYAHSADQPR